MKSEKFKESFYVRYFIEKPIFYLAFLILGITLFIIMASIIDVPMYKTIQGNIVHENNKIVLNERLNYNGLPIFLYQSRDDNLEKVDDYEIINGEIYLKSIPETLMNVSDRINIDIETSNISLLKLILTKGGIN